MTLIDDHDYDENDVVMVENVSTANPYAYYVHEGKVVVIKS
jgi:hypothetical protein